MMMMMKNEKKNIKFRFSADSDTNGLGVYPCPTSSSDCNPHGKFPQFPCLDYSSYCSGWCRVSPGVTFILCVHFASGAYRYVGNGYERALQPAGRPVNSNNYYSHFKHCPAFIRKRRGGLRRESSCSCP